MKYKIKLCCILIIVGLSSCKKYLEEKSNNSLTVPTTLSDLQALLDNANVMNNLITPNAGDASTDDYFVLPAAYGNFSLDENKNIYGWKFLNTSSYNDWGIEYNVVYNCNLVLERVNEIPVLTSNQTQWENVKGTALFHRAYSFLNLAWIHAKAFDEGSSVTDLGIVLKLESDFNVPSVRSTVKETYERIVADAIEAAQYLPALPQHVYRPSKAAAYTLLARTYISMRKYDLALKYADSAFQLQSTLLNYNDPLVKENNNVPFPNILLNPEIIFYSEQNQTTPANSFSNAKVDTVFFSSYDINDKRRTVFFIANQGYRRFCGSYSGNPSRYFTGLTTAELYLIKAECYARKGDVSNALSNLNALLVKRWKTGFFTGVTASSANEALDKILQERRKELIMRGIRWSDIKRLNKEGLNIVLTRKLPDGTILTLQADRNYYALPIPKEIVDLTGMPQNPN